MEKQQPEALSRQPRPDLPHGASPAAFEPRTDPPRRGGWGGCCAAQPRLPPGGGVCSRPLGMLPSILQGRLAREQPCLRSCLLPGTACAVTNQWAIQALPLAQLRATPQALRAAGPRGPGRGRVRVTPPQLCGPLTNFLQIACSAAVGALGSARQPAGRAALSSCLLPSGWSANVTLALGQRAEASRWAPGPGVVQPQANGSPVPTLWSCHTRPGCPPLASTQARDELRLVQATLLLLLSLLFAAEIDPDW